MPELPKTVTASIALPRASAFCQAVQFWRSVFTDFAPCPIVHADLIEISTTAAPVHEGTGFAVVSGKALGAGDDALSGIAELATAASIDRRIAWLDVKRDLANLRVDTAILAARTRADALTL